MSSPLSVSRTFSSPLQQPISPSISAVKRNSIESFTLSSSQSFPAVPATLPLGSPRKVLPFSGSSPPTFTPLANSSDSLTDYYSPLKIQLTAQQQPVLPPRIVANNPALPAWPAITKTGKLSF